MKLMYINGQFTKGNGTEEIEVTNPATEEALDTVPRGTAEDVESAVRSSNEAFKSWRKMGANERTILLQEVASKVRSHKEEIVHLLTLEVFRRRARTWHRGAGSMPRDQARVLGFQYGG